MRKKIIILFIIIVIALIYFNLPTPAQVKDSGEELSIFVINDNHLLADDLHDDGELFEQVILNGDGKTLDYSADILDALLYEAKQDKVDLVIVNGDMTLNGEKQTHEQLAQTFKEFEEDTGIDVLVIPGNHDVDNPTARGYEGNDFYFTDSISLSEFSKIYADFGYDEALYKGDASASYVYKPSEDVYILMLDTSIQNDLVNYSIPNGSVKNETIEWIEEMSDIAKEDGADILVFAHHNILHHYAPSKSTLTIGNASEVYDLFMENDIKLTFTGHAHAQDIATKTEGDYTLTDVTTASLAIYPHVYGEITYKEGVVMYNAKEVDVEQYALDNDIEDPNLINFDEYSSQVLYDVSYNMLKKRYEGSDYTDEEIDLMTQVVTVAHMEYINNSSVDVISLIEDMEGYEMIINDPENPNYGYLMGIIDDDTTDDSNYHLTLDLNE